jgi:hypothetical protein
LFRASGKLGNRPNVPARRVGWRRNGPGFRGLLGHTGAAPSLAASWQNSQADLLAFVPSRRRRSLIPLELTLAPMRFFALRVELRDVVPVQRPHDADASEQRRAAAIETRSKASIAARHSSASCSFFGSAAMYSPASSSITGLRPSTSIGSSKGRLQPRSVMISSPVGTAPLTLSCRASSERCSPILPHTP